MINVAKATIQRRLDSKNVVSFSDDKFLEEFFCIRKLKEKYMGMSYLNLCEICSEELFDYRSDELLEEFLNMLLNDDYKDLKNASEKKLLKISQLEDEELSYNKYDEFDRILAEFLLNNEEE